jgi:hypothetical protein
MGKIWLQGQMLSMGGAALTELFFPIAGLQSGGSTERKRSLEVEDLKDILGLIGRLELFDMNKRLPLYNKVFNSNCLENEWHSDE